MGAKARESMARTRAHLTSVPSGQSAWVSSGARVQWRALGPVEAVVGGRLVDLVRRGSVRCLGCC